VTTIAGECFCGAFRYEITGKLRDARSCHCSRCRKAFSSQASAYALVDPDAFQWVAGEETLTTYTGSQGHVHGVTLGCVDGDPGVDITQHIFTGSKAPWEILPDGIVAFEAGPNATD
jgi:hypothetical protein